MTFMNLVSLLALDDDLLSPVVQQATGRSDAVITGFAVRAFGDRGVMSADGLFLVEGQATAAGQSVPWSVVLKILRRPETEQRPGDLWYWRREYLAFESGLLSALPGPLSFPRQYALMDRGGQLWMWMEHVVDTTGPAWHLDHYVHAARQLGQFNGAYLTGTPLPDHPWLLRDLVMQWVTVLNPEHAWDSEHVRRHFPPELRRRVLRLWAEREQFWAMLRAVPQVFSHFDFHRRNLLIRGRDVVAIDWAWCGIGPVGSDLNFLVGMSWLFGECPDLRLDDLESAAIDAYIAGLRDAGWQGDEYVPWSGYALWTALHFGLTTPALTAYWCDEARQDRAAQLFGGTPDTQAALFAEMCEFSLERADAMRPLRGIF